MVANALTQIAVASDKLPTCDDSLQSLYPLEDKLISHVKGWMRQYTGFKVEAISVSKSSIVVRGTEVEQINNIPPNIPRRLSYKMKFRKGEYQLKIIIDGAKKH